MSLGRAVVASERPELLAGLFEGDVLFATAPLTAGLAELEEEERAVVERAVPKRQREFAQGRVLARRLLERLGAPVGPLLRDADRVPSWPAGVVGSISHTDGLCAVAVARQEAVWALGLDVEGDEPLDEGLEPRICTPAERRWLAARPGPEARRLAKAIFSVKEAAYKACFPPTRERWDFLDLEVELAPREERFAARAPAGSRLAGRTLRGRVARRGRFWLATVTLRREDVPR
jgi:4'-phosphopantetheinyl transferase EntD